MAVAAGVVVGIVQANLDVPLRVSQVAAWNPGVLFLGIGFLLAAVTFLLATILGELRDGGTSVQQALGEKALILKRPLPGMLFPPAMMMGLMTLIATLVIGFVQAAKLDNDPIGAADIGAWIGRSASQASRCCSPAWRSRWRRSSARSASRRPGSTSSRTSTAPDDPHRTLAPPTAALFAGRPSLAQGAR